MADFPAGIDHRPRISGVRHWRWQRISALALFVAMAYFVFVVSRLGTLDHAQAVAFVTAPINMLGLVCLVVIGLFHASLGLEVVIEDYVPLNKGRRPLIYTAKAALFSPLRHVDLGDERISTIARRHGVSAAQVALTFVHQQGALIATASASRRAGKYASVDG